MRESSLTVLLTVIGLTHSCKSPQGSKVESEGIIDSHYFTMEETIAKAKSLWEHEGLLTDFSTEENFADFLKVGLTNTIRFHGDNSGSGIIIGYSDDLNGYVFLSAGHVFTSEANDGFNTVEYTVSYGGNWNTGQAVSTIPTDSYYVIVKQGATAIPVIYKYDRGRLDLAIGLVRMPKLRNNIQELKINKKVANQKTIFSFGYPKQPIRDSDARGPSIELLRSKCKATISDTLKAFPNQQTVLEDQPEKARAARFDLKLCQEYLKKIKRKTLNIPYNASENLAPSIAAGKVIFQDEFGSVTDADVGTGMSGGPVFEASTGNLVGITRSGVVDSFPDMHGNMVSSTVFAPTVMAYQKVDRKILSELCSGARDLLARKLCRFALDRVAAEK